MRQVERTLLESRRVAELLAQLPKEVSVEALVMESMGAVERRRSSVEPGNSIGADQKRKGAAAEGRAK